ncbi:MAG: hypothetical protein HKP27_01100, partial [Myxococcales bacterium]|nr:hypothetical protein [Myxococcales bacterium]
TWDLRGDEPTTLAIALDNPGSRGFFSLYYYVTHYFLGVLPDQVWAVRLPAVLAGVLGLFAFGWLAREVLGREEAICATLLVCFGGFHIEISQFARYYSSVFLLSSLHFLFFVRFLRTGRLSLGVLSVGLGLVTVACHFASALVFVVTATYCLLALRFDALLPRPALRKPIAIALGAGVCAGLAAVPTVIKVFSVWLSYPDWNLPRWRILPSLILDHLTLPMFVAAGFGLWWLWRRGDRPVAVLAALAVGFTLLTLGLGGLLMNFAPRYGTALFPWFYLAAGACCGAMLRSARPQVGAVAALAPLAILVAASVPSAVSYFLERQNVSYRRGLEVVLAQAVPGDLIETNVALFPGSDAIEIALYRSEPWNRTYPWQEALSGSDAQWFLYEVSRTGYAPALEAWLIANADKVLTQRSNRIDRHMRQLDLWKRRPKGSP